ncbi:nuclear transport factor 2 family protein [Roseovarius sp. CAU 1744]|uniref:nuclear transport factor 2 family protein n=1 Tax=Roseovarius sp. CAU 1744 TaxID=3140368 RepID=UPI00325B2191
MTYEVEKKCRTASALYCDYRDAGNFDLLSKLFLPDGVIDYNGVLYSGRRAIAEFVKSRAGAPTFHHQSFIRFSEISDGSIEAESRILVFTEPLDEQAGIGRLLVAASYYDKFSEHGSDWLFEERRIRSVALK